MEEIKNTIYSEFWLFFKYKFMFFYKYVDLLRATLITKKYHPLKHSPPLGNVTYISL